ncbi:hypothetical protein [Natrialba swarupiae]|uniref:Uncharacterized protein n=1 Tax=Natrialba swarupiae TaxID=2448032 RepID=A0A5D5APT8_9EURY|nr:hypothetical protein [Natrialba swarupiae]TYT63868.1 hypothetical protein FYC77_01220 [Natrialba swarupiae]
MGSSDTEKTLESYGPDIGERTSGLTRVREWVLVEGDRLVVAALVSIAAFLGFLVLDEVGIISVLNGDSITRLAGGMIAGTFSLVTLVVSINQLILSREFGAAGESERQLEGVVSFREDVAETAAVPAVPASPTRLLELLAASVRDHGGELESAIDDNDDELAAQVGWYAADVQERADRLDETLEHTKFGTFRAVSAAIGYDDAWQLYVARHVKGRYGDDLSAEGREALEELIETLELFSVAREHFKTTYLQRELTRFSQLTIYCGVPAILSAMLIGFLYADLGGPSINVDFLPVVVAALVAVVVSPLALLTSYILRTATVTRRTASVGPMLPQKAPDEGPFDVTYAEESESGSPTGSD